MVAKLATMKQEKTAFLHQCKNPPKHNLGEISHHETRENRQKAIQTFLKNNPQMSNRQIGVIVGAHHTTVQNQRAELETTGEISQLNKTVGADGKERTTTPQRNYSFDLP